MVLGLEVYAVRGGMFGDGEGVVVQLLYICIYIWFCLCPRSFSVWAFSTSSYLKPVFSKYYIDSCLLYTPHLPL